MFGYIKPLKPELKVKEAAQYDGMYCGLCKQLGLSFGPFLRLSLSYDFTFLSMLKASLDDSCPQYETKRCMLNPLRKKSCCASSEPLIFSASIAMLLLYYKVKDNLKDSGFFGRLGSLCLLPFVSSARKKALKRFAVYDRVIAACMEDQAVLEQDGCTDVDRACEPTAKMLEFICVSLSEDSIQQRILSRTGYLLGRWIYMMDALDDLEKDIKQASFNPFLPADRSEVSGQDLKAIRENAAGSINLTMAEIVSSYELLPVRHFKPILDNIVYLGLRETCSQLLLKGEK